MDIQDIDNLPAGPELDALVAEKVMGDICGPECTDAPFQPKYSTDIAAAWEVVAVLNKRGFRMDLSIGHDGDCESVILTAGDINCPHEKPFDLTDGHGFTVIEHEPIAVQTAPLAICRAALKAVTHD